MKQKVKLKDIASYSKGSQINGTELIENGEFDYLNGGINPSGKWNEANCNADTIAISEGGNSCGYVNYMRKPFWCGAHCYYLYDTVANTKYLYYALKSQQERIMKLRSGACMPNIKKSDLGNFEFIFDDDDKQQKNTTDILNKIERVIELRQKEIFYLDELVKARFVEMFGDPQLNPKGWKVVNISEVVGGKVSNGFFAKRDDYVNDGNVSVLGVANIVNRMYSKIDELPRTNADDNEIKKYEVKYGDMLFCRSSLVAEGIGKASIIPENVQKNILFECHVIRLQLDLNKCVPEFMQTLSTMDSFRNQVIAQSKTATMTTIGQDGILKTDIILPPLESQRKFYNFIKQVNKSKSAIKKSLEETQILFDSLMQKYFG